MGKFLSKEQMEKLTTSRLIKYLHSFLTYRDNGQHWDFDEIYERPELTKDSDLWKEHHRLIKSVLATREHVE